ncbi:hypothetical protein AAIH49_31485 [Pseudomonas aeruginosa]|uniref:DUF7281 domain-containing protein n=7 Tax=Pseudomonas aeruginosa TaxID=287 RepID=A0AAQ3LUD4_PSEAI|nr:hypothetical protein [Pseudomonas aeruginosa]ARG86629.1 hypothetical protein E613_25380 [Pseudomonas aeruginosa]AUA76918.1 hypothetical protein CWI21_12600 [Pseudomonas aeruginosa]AUB01543.1 hypothetical protein CWI20_12600 [Pseudomonas aeruginosa]AVN42225.1 hypothetical protein AM474_01530 [Pseudomonas aeruginosa]AVR82797.1 hypothetical protein C8257_13000 [Pseudomonas aeruginosa]
MTSLLQSKRVVEMISRVVRMASTEVALGDVWLQIHQAYGVGRISGRRLLLDAEDRKALRSLAERHTGWDPHVAGSKIQGGRAELAASMRNEKLSGERVAKDLVLVSAPSGKIQLGDSVQPLMPGCMLTVPSRLVAGQRRIIIVENLQAMLDASRFVLPEGLVDAPFVFRGSPQFSIGAVVDLAKRVPEVYYFPDADPQGLVNANKEVLSKGTLGPSPEAFQTMHDAGVSKLQDYETQASLMPGLLAADNPLAKIIHHYRAGFSQESMAAFSCPLLCYV